MTAPDPTPAQAPEVCGERFGRTGICDLPKGHAPISEAMGWLHSEDISPAPPRGPFVVGEPAADRLLRSMDYRLHPGVERLTREQVAAVLHALADHTAITAALGYRPDPSSPWPHATSMGRWFHDTADQLEDR